MEKKSAKSAKEKAVTFSSFDERLEKMLADPERRDRIDAARAEAVTAVKDYEWAVGEYEAGSRDPWVMELYEKGHP